MSSTHRMPSRAGVGLRLPHIEEAVATQPSVGWLEIHPENFLANPHATELLQELAGRYPISVHTVGLSVGSVSGIDRPHLLSNVYLSAHNMGYDAHAYIDGLPAEAITELHLGGFTPEADAATPGGTVLIDTHANEVASPAWDLYAYALGRFGLKPTLIEWDNDIPAFTTLLDQAAIADAVAARTLEPEARRVAAR